MNSKNNSSAPAVSDVSESVSADALTSLPWQTALHNHPAISTNQNRGANIMIMSINRNRSFIETLEAKA